MQVLSSLGAPPSPARSRDPERPFVRVALVQHRWRSSVDATMEELAGGIELAARQGARLVALPELTLARYLADTLPDATALEGAESMTEGVTARFASEQARRQHVFVHASVFRTDEHSGRDGLGTNTALLFAPDGSLVAHTDKLHIPVTTGYHEDRYFRAAKPGVPYPVHQPAGLGLRLGLPTCWDEWFPEVARAYSLQGADLLVYPTAIGSEPGFPDFDTEPLWQQVIIGNAIANGLFVMVPNRWGNEGTLQFYGSSFIADPFGRILVQAPRDASAVLVADIDPDARRDWLELFPFLRTRRPDTYAILTDPVNAEHPLGERRL